MRPLSLLGAVGAALLIALVGPASAGDDTPTVSWSPASVDVTVARGETLSVPVTFTATQKLANIEIRVVPALAPYLTVAPTAVDSLSAKTPMSSALTFTVPDIGPSLLVKGAVQVLARGKNQSRPLPVVLHIGERIGASGGSVASSDGIAGITIPAGALSGDGSVMTVEPTTGAVPADFGTAVTPLYDFGPSGTVFAKLVTITFVYEPSALPLNTDPNDLRVAFQKTDGTWQGLPTTVDAVNHTATASAMHFTKFVVVKSSKGPKIAPVTNLALLHDASGALLTWTPPVDERYAFASIYRASSIAGPFVLLAFSDADASSYLDANPLGAESCYEVRAVDRAGFESDGEIVCIPEPTETLFDKTDAAADAGQCAFGQPVSIAPDFPELHNDEKLCAQEFVVDRAFSPRALAVRLYVTDPVDDGVYFQIRSDAPGDITGCGLDSAPGTVVLTRSQTVSSALLILPPDATDAAIVTFVFGTDVTLPAGTYWFVSRSTGGAMFPREYHITMTLEGFMGLRSAGGVHDPDANTFTWCGGAPQMWRSKFELVYR